MGAVMIVAGRRDVRRSRHPLPDDDRRRPAGVPRQPDRRARGVRTVERRPRRTRGGGPGGEGDRAAGRGRQAAGRRSGFPISAPAPGLRRQPALVQHRRRKAARRSPGCAGKVVLVDFWTYTCINCIRTLPYLKAWDAKYRDDGLDDRRRALARVPVREVRPATSPDAIDQNELALSRGPGQRARDLERLRQPVLAGEVPDRRRRAASATRTSARATTTRPRRRSAAAGRGRPHRRREARAAGQKQRPSPTAI